MLEQPQMFGLESYASQLLYATVMLVATLPNGDISTGSAFFYRFTVDTNKLLVVVTNKHVVSGAATVKFRLHEASLNQETGKTGPGKDSFDVVVPKEWFIDHPGDVDLCAIPVALLRQQASKQNKEIFVTFLSDDLIAGDDKLGELSALEDVVMAGYPIGLIDIANNFPIIRKGITASHPLIDFNNKPWGVVDIASFPGSSGSPILVMNQGGYSRPDGLVIGSRTLFLGVLFGGPQYTADGTLEIKEIPTGKTLEVTTSVPMHLGYYVKAKELKVLQANVVKALNLKSQ